MYACICHAVTEQQVHACAGGGFRHVVAATRAGSGCGTCVQRLRSILERPAAGSAGAAEAPAASAA